MQTQWLSCFLLLSQSKSFSDAAQQLNVNSSTLIRKMRQLEAELGVELFSRFDRPLALTAAGHFFLKQAPQLLQTLYQLENLPSHIQRCSLLIAWHGAWGVHLLPQLITGFQAQFPHQVIESHSLALCDAIDLFQSGLLDLWLSTYQVNDLQELDLHFMDPLDSIELWAGTKSEFVIVGKPGPMGDWQNYQYIDLSLMTFHTPIWNDVLYPRQIKAHLTSVSDAVALCCQSDLVAYLPRILVQPLLDKNTLVIRAQAPMKQSIRPGILLNHANLGKDALAVIKVLQAAGFQAEK